MSSFKINVNIKKDNTSGWLKASVTDDIKEQVVTMLKEVFELEMLTAEITKRGKRTVIFFNSNNVDRLQSVWDGVVKAWRRNAGLNNISNN